MRKILMTVFLLILLFGCMRVRTPFAPLGYDTITSKLSDGILLTTGDADRPYTELGVIFVKGRHIGYEKVMGALRAKAEKIGADAVIKIEFRKRFYHSYRPYCQGVAIKYDLR